MLKYIEIENMFSFSNKIALQLEEGVSVIYGKNNVGKSNLLKAIEVWANVLNGKIGYLESSKCKYGKDNIIKMSCIFQFDNVEYAYGFEYFTNGEIFLRETLCSREKKIVSLDMGKVTSDILSTGQINALNMYDVSKSGIMDVLRNMHDENGEIELINSIQEAYRFYRLNKTGNKKNALEEIYSNKKIQQKILEELKISDLDIESVKFKMVEKITPLLFEGINDHIPKREIEVEIQHPLYENEFKNESDGTRRYFNYLIDLYTMIESGYQYICVEEPENFLHDELFKKVINIFQNSGIQVLITTHNQMVLEEKLLKKTNIIILERKQTETEIYTLASFSELRNTSRHNWKNFYKHNKFGGFPNVK